MQVPKRSCQSECFEVRLMGTPFVWGLSPVLRGSCRGKIFIRLVTSDRQVKAPREGSERRNYVLQNQEWGGTALEGDVPFWTISRTPP